MLGCSRLWLIRIRESGISTFSFNGVKARAWFISGTKDYGYVSLIISLADNNCILYIDGKVKEGKIVEICPMDNHSNGYQYVIRSKNEVYKLSTLTNKRLAVLEEIKI